MDQRPDEPARFVVIRGDGVDDERGTPRGDRGARARALADAFSERFRPTLPSPDPDAIPRTGRHVRVTAETPMQVYVDGQMYTRDARARITARSQGMPGGWTIRLALVDVQVVAVNATNPGSRADPAILRAHKQMADPSMAAALAAPLRNSFPGRPVASDNHSLFSAEGLVFVRAASIVLPLGDDPLQDDQLFKTLVAAAQASLINAQRPEIDARNRRPSGETDPIGPTLRRGHLRIIQ